MSKEDKQRILATNRLLEILRSERDPEDVASLEEDIVDSDFLKDDDGLQYVSAPDSDQLSETKKKEKKDADILIEEEDQHPIPVPESDQVSETTQQEKDDFSILFSDENDKIEQQPLKDIDEKSVVEPEEQINNDDQLYEDEDKKESGIGGV